MWFHDGGLDSDQEIESLKQRLTAVNEELTAARLLAAGNVHKATAAELRATQAEADLLVAREKLEGAEKRAVRAEGELVFLKQELADATTRTAHAVRSLDRAATLAGSHATPAGSHAVHTKPKSAEVKAEKDSYRQRPHEHATD